MERKLGFRLFLLLALFALMMVLGRNEYVIIAERFVRTVCTSCIGI